MRQRHALHRRAAVQGDRQAHADVRDQGRIAGLLEGRRARVVDGRHGRAAVCLARDPAGRGGRRHPRDRPADRTRRQADPARAVGREHGQPACHFLGRRRQRLRPGEARAAAGARSDLSRAGEYFVGAGGVARAHRVAHLGARRRSHPGVRIGRLRGGGRRGAPRSHRPRGDGDAAGRRPAHLLARTRRPRADDRPGGIRIRRQVRAALFAKQGAA